MKKIISIIIALALALALCSCGSGENGESKDTPVPMGDQKTEAPNITESSETEAPKPSAEAPTDTPASSSKLISEGKTVTADYEQGTFLAKYMVDGDDMPESAGERWSAYDDKQDNYTHWAMIDLGSVYEIRDNDITFEFAALYYTVEVSVDGTEGSWTKVFDSYEEGSSLGPNIFDSFNAENAKGRFIKLTTYVPEEITSEHVDWLASNTGGHPYFSIYEWAVYGVDAQ